MAKSTKSKGKNARTRGKSGGSGGRTTPSAKTAARQRPAATAKEAAAKAVTKPAAKGDGAKAAAAGAAASPVAASGDPTRAKPSAPRPRPAPTKRTTPSASSRYTPPTPKADKVSPIWVPIVMFTCLGAGMLTIILNYVNVLPGPDPSNAYLMAGLALITVGFVTATKFH